MSMRYQYYKRRIRANARKGISKGYNMFYRQDTSPEAMAISTLRMEFIIPDKEELGWCESREFWNNASVGVGGVRKNSKLVPITEDDFMLECL